MCKCAAAALGGTKGGGEIRRGRIAEDEEFDERPNEYYDGELAEEKALGKG
jgi:hypothetical protein